jgi:hypothetical protein
MICNPGNGLNIFMALILLMNSLPQPFCLNQFGDNPLEHAFGRSRIQCRDVNNTMLLLAALANNYSTAATDGFLSIAAVPERRCSISIQCLSLVPRKQSVFLLGTRVIARPLLVWSANPANLIGEFLGRDFPAPLVLTAWAELKRIPGFPAPHVPDTLIFPRKSPSPATISSNHIFLGLIKSPRPDAFMGARHKMGHALENKLYTIKQKVHDIFHCQLTVRELAMPVHEGAIIKNVDYPG